MVNLKSKLKQVQKQRGALLVMNLMIIALCLVLFWGTIHMFRELNYAFSRPAKTNWMENNVQSENYAYLLVNYHEDMVYGGLLSGTKKECYGVARYFEAASMYKAFLQIGDTERAAREKEKMDAAYEEMGDWNIAADSIREKLGLEYGKNLDKSRKNALQLLAYDNDDEKDQYDRKASQREGKDTVTCGWEPLMTEDRKPPLESCARRIVPGSGEAQRRTGVNGDRAGYVFVSIRVVPPSDRSLFRER